MDTGRFFARLALAGLLAALMAVPWPVARAEDATGAGSAGAEAVELDGVPSGGREAAIPADIRPMAAGELVLAELDGGPRAYAFTAPSGSVYDLCVFPAGLEVSPVGVRLYQGGEAVDEGVGLRAVVSRRLVSGADYVVVLSGTGRVRFEVARHALSRSFDDPMPLEAGGGGYAKAIARQGDVHWYAVTARAGGSVVLAGVPEEGGPRLEALLFDGSGRLLAQSTPTLGGACLLDFASAGGETCRVRVSSPEGGTGLYSIYAAQAAGGLPEAVVLSETDIALQGRESRRLGASVRPEGAADMLLWESTDPEVVRVEQDGTVTGRQAGTAVVTAYAAGAVRARCRVEVARVPVTGVRLLARGLALNVGDDAALEWQVLPENASSPRVSFEAAPEGVVTVDRGGVVRAVSEGEAVVTVRTGEGGFVDAVTVRVGPALKRYRALLVGEQSYAPAVARPRPGSANSVAAMRSMLGTLSFGGTRYEVTTRLDVSRDGALEAVAEAFAGATDQDAALIYITCHGWYAGGMTYFQMYDGSVLAAAELRQALDAVPGQILLLVDCCGSGGVIGRAGSAADILKGVREGFDGLAGPSLFPESRFRVLASASVEQDSYRLSFSQDASQKDMATAFARAVCEAGGWSVDRAARSAMRADVDYDDVVTLDELYSYAARRVMWYLTLGGGDEYVQTVQVSPEGDAGSVFERTAGQEDD